MRAGAMMLAATSLMLAASPSPAQRGRGGFGGGFHGGGVGGGFHGGGFGGRGGFGGGYRGGGYRGGGFGRGFGYGGFRGGYGYRGYGYRGYGFPHYGFRYGYGGYGYGLGFFGLGLFGGYALGSPYYGYPAYGYGYGPYGYVLDPDLYYDAPPPVAYGDAAGYGTAAPADDLVAAPAAGDEPQPGDPLPIDPGAAATHRAAPQPADAQHCPLYWDASLGRYVPNCG